MAMGPGDHIPDVKVTTLTDGGPKPVQTGELLGTGKVVLIAVPGAFTPTCSDYHLPGFVHRVDEVKAKGVDTVACLAVNDAFVVGAWAASQGVDDQVLMLADGNGEFTKAMGLEMDGSGYGMGVRSQRYAAVIEDGVVKKLLVEQPGQFEVSSVESVLSKL